jgi:carbon-monoxide dehydrogenase large subunit
VHALSESRFAATQGESPRRIHGYIPDLHAPAEVRKTPIPPGITEDAPRFRPGNFGLGCEVNGLGKGLCGQLLSGSFMDYAMPRADNFPFFNTQISEVPTSEHPLGIRPAGEGALCRPWRW